jgi:hypothetical protein
MTLTKCREVAARIWCDQDFKNQVMDVDLCEQIAELLYAHAVAAEYPIKSKKDEQ